MSGQVVLKNYKEIKIIAYLGLLTFLLLCLITYSHTDPSWSIWLHHHHAVKNALGFIGACCADTLINSVGLCAYFLPLICIINLVNIAKNQKMAMFKQRLIGGFLCLFSCSGLLSLSSLVIVKYPSGAGGWLGYTVSLFTLDLLNSFGATLFLGSILLIGLSLILHHGISNLLLNLLVNIKHFFQHFGFLNHLINQSKSLTQQKGLHEEKHLQAKKQIKLDDTATKEKLNSQPMVNISTRRKQYVKPSLQLLNKPVMQSVRKEMQQLIPNLSAEVEEKLKAFNISAKVEQAHPGPVITQLELQLDSGVKASKITSLSVDLARLLSVRSVRVVEIIPGKTTVGLELPNINREMVGLKEILSSKIFVDAKSALTIALGKDIRGEPVIADLGKMPHLLIAGTTGSGKSVGVNAIILSLLYKANPNQVKLVLIDPKMLELSVYQDIPHLLTPVVTDVQEAAGVLRWCVQEMERRYKLMALLGVRNIEGFNIKVADMRLKGQTQISLGDADDTMVDIEELPFIVVVADEFADMMMVVGKSVEQLIARIAQKARASGIHLILATQRPSVDVITGLIKANIPTRIAFQVSSRIDSRTIIDQQGADQLLGAGDMLYLPTGASIPTRVHGAFVADDEVHRVVKALKKNAPVKYNDLSCETVSTAQNSHPDANRDEDPLYQQAVDIVARSRKASISSIQRRLRIGYNRAATIVEKMEEQGIIGPMKTAGQRQVLIPKPDDA